MSSKRRKSEDDEDEIRPVSEPHTPEAQTAMPTVRYRISDLLAHCIPDDDDGDLDTCRTELLKMLSSEEVELMISDRWTRAIEGKKRIRVDSTPALEQAAEKIRETLRSRYNRLVKELSEKCTTEMNAIEKEMKDSVKVLNDIVEAKVDEQEEAERVRKLKRLEAQKKRIDEKREKLQHNDNKNKKKEKEPESEEEEEEDDSFEDTRSDDSSSSSSSSASPVSSASGSSSGGDDD